MYTCCIYSICVSNIVFFINLLLLCLYCRFVQWGVSPLSEVQHNLAQQQQSSSTSTSSSRVESGKSRNTAVEWSFMENVRTILNCTIQYYTVAISLCM